MEFRKYELNPVAYENYKTRVVDAGRESIIAHLWGRKLAEFVKVLRCIKYVL